MRELPPLLLALVVLGPLTGCQTPEDESSSDAGAPPSDAAPPSDTDTQGDTSAAQDADVRPPPPEIPATLAVSAEECGRCHPTHYDEWRGSMHAYATKDPFFLAMNAKAVAETAGEIGQTCMECHAPVASRYGRTPIEDGPDGKKTMLLPEDEQSFDDAVGCVSCHAIETVHSPANAEFSFSEESYFGSQPSAAAEEDHPMQASTTLTDSKLCGSCHDIRPSPDLPFDNTYAEWSKTMYNGDMPTHCHTCHMYTYEGPVAVDGEVKTLHRHTFVGTDQAFAEDFPHREEQGAMVQQLLQGAATLSVRKGEQGDDSVSIEVTVTNVGAGHNLPSGTAAERQVWVHLEVIDDAAEPPLFESGMLDAKEDLMDGRFAPTAGDPQLLWFGQLLKDTQGEVVHFMWEATGLEDRTLPQGQSKTHAYSVPLATVQGRYVTVRATLKYRTFAPALARQLVAEGYMKADAVGTIPIIEMASATAEMSF